MPDDPNAPPTTKEVMREVGEAIASALGHRRRLYGRIDRELDLALDVLARLRSRIDDVPDLSIDEDGRVVITEVANAIA